MTGVFRLRFPLLALGLASLFLGVWAGLLRLGWSLPQGRANLIELHGPLMVFGFLGTVISLERAVALRRPWGYLAPAGTIAGAALLLAGLRQGVGELVLLVAGCVLAALFVVILRAHATAPTATLLLGALLWVGGDVLWLQGDPLVQVVPWWTGFLVLTIAGERLELAAMTRLTRTGRLLFLALTSLFLAGLALSTADPDGGVRIAGAACLGYALWLARFDIARHTVRRTGLPRFVALALLTGYVWLAVGGVLLLRDGAAVAGFAHDAQLHALFLGFVFSMVVGHAPVIFPGVLGIAIPFRRVFYLHLALLHAGLVVRLSGDLSGSFEAARWGGLLNAAAIGLFLAATVVSALAARVHRPGASAPRSGAARRPRRPHRQRPLGAGAARHHRPGVGEPGAPRF
ncbi:MAG TPA: hypothetical protein VE995_04120 [Gaiellaceae bacterium]|nr:hypothetical protein [Gaiellaceae bacterium]